MPLAPTCLMGPRHIHPLVNTASDYAQRQIEAIRDGRAKYPNLPWRDPIDYVGHSVFAYVTGGMWQVPCACGNRPSVSPEWKIARCFDCGFVYREHVIALPSSHEVSEIERLLVLRPHLATRNWLPTETVADLRAENAAFGIVEPEAA